MGIPEGIVVLLIALPILGVVYVVRTVLRNQQQKVWRGVRRVSVATDDDLETMTALPLPNGRIGPGMVLASRYKIRRLISSAVWEPFTRPGIWNSTAPWHSR